MSQMINSILQKMIFAIIISSNLIKCGLIPRPFGSETNMFAEQTPFNTPMALPRGSLLAYSQGGVEDLISEAQFDSIFLHKNHYNTMTDNGFDYNPENPELFCYTGFIAAANSYALFCAEGDSNTRKRELAAFLANTSHETTGGWGGYDPTAESYIGRYDWGYCYPRELSYHPNNPTNNYTDPTNTNYPPVSGQSYHGRGPIQISWNYNYGAFSEEILGDKDILLQDPEKVLDDSVIFFQSALWFWMTPQPIGSGLEYAKPSCHDIMVNMWKPTTPQSTNDTLLAGFPVTINVINGGLESGLGRTNSYGPEDRLGFYLRYCEILGVESMDTLWLGYSDTTYSFSNWDDTSQVHKELNSCYAENFTLQQRVAGNYSVSGYIKENNVGLTRCYLKLMNDSVFYEQAITDSTGYFIIDKIPSGSYEILPEKADYIFSNSGTFNLSSNTIVDDILATSTAVSISGYVTKNSDSLSGVTVTLYDITDTLTTVTNSNGFFRFIPVVNGDYTLGFAKNYHTFDTNNIAITVNNQSIIQSAIATFNGQYYNISGNITDEVNENLPGVNVSILGDKNEDTITDASGNYSFSNCEQGGNFTLTPTLINYSFQDTSFNNLINNGIANFTAQIPTSIHGNVTIESGTPLQNVTIRISNIADTLATDIDGSFNSGVLTDGNCYMITPVKAGYIFEPPYSYYDSIYQAEEINFTGTLVPQEQPKGKIVYYFTNWGVYARDFHVHNIEANYLTHINYAFLMPFIVDGVKNIDDDVEFRAGKNAKIISVVHTDDNKSVGLAITDPFADIQKFEDDYLGSQGTYVSTVQEWLNVTPKSRGVLGQLIRLKQQQQDLGRDLKIMASIGGWTMGQHFPEIALEEEYRIAFGNACKQFCDATGFDGVDIDWEFPVYGGTDGTETIDNAAVPAQPHYADPQSEPVYFLKLMKNIREQIGDEYILTMASSQVPNNILNQFIWPGSEAFFETNYSSIYNRVEEGNILDYLDFVTNMTYDYGGFWCSKTTHESPLYNSNDADDINSNMSASALIDTLLSINGGNVDPSKLVMGLPFYGKMFSNINDGGRNGKYQSHDKTTRERGSWEANAPATEISTTVDYADLRDGKAMNGSKHQFLNNPASGYVEYWDSIVKCPYLYNPNTEIWITYDDDNTLTEKVKFINIKYLGGAMVWELSQDTEDGFLIKTIYNQIQQIKLKISGTIVDNQGNGIDGVTVTINGGSAVTTDNTGEFTFLELESGNDYTIDISKQGMVFLDNQYAFTPLSESKLLSVIGSDSSYSISGSVFSNNSLLPNVDINLYLNDVVLDTINSADGNYSFTNTLGGFNYIIKATKNLYSYANGSDDIILSNLSSNLSQQNFTLEMDNYTISGYINDVANNPIENVTIELTGSNVATLTTNSVGFFETQALEASGNYTITPSKQYYFFTPANYVYTNLTQNDTCNFNGSAETMIFGYVKDSTTPIVGVTVRYTIGWIGGGHPWDVWANQGTITDNNGYYEFRNGPDVVTNLNVDITRTVTPPWPGTYYNFIPSTDTAYSTFSGVLELNYNTSLTPQISLDTDSLVFGTMDTTSVVDTTLAFVIKNTGFNNSKLYIDSITNIVTPYAYNIINTTLPDTIETVNDSLIIEVTLNRGVAPDTYVDSLIIYSGANAVDTVTLKAILQFTKWHVSKNGDDGTGTGTTTNPVLTILKGLELVGVNDTLFINNGIYTELVDTLTIHCILAVDTVTINNIIINNGTIYINDEKRLIINGYLINNNTIKLEGGTLEIQ